MYRERQYIEGSEKNKLYYYKYYDSERTRIRFNNDKYGMILDITNEHKYIRQCIKFMKSKIDNLREDNMYSNNIRNKDFDIIKKVLESMLKPKINNKKLIKGIKELIYNG